VVKGVSINIDGTTCENGANSSSDFCKKHGAFPMCKECNSYSAKRGEDLCGYCNPAKHVKRKELRIKKYLEEKELLFFHDKVVKLSNNKVAKPDFLFVDNTIEHRVILEVDEYQHTRNEYTPVEERRREQLIQQGLGKPCIFIRFNPDAFKINGKTKRMPNEKRQLILLERIHHWLKTKPTEQIEREFLFYNDN
jgi:hypothetical protein